MQFQKGQSGNPAGRPVGARNKATVMAEMLMQGEAEGLARIAIEQAKAGDVTALRMCLDRVAPPYKHRTVTFEIPTLESAADAARALAVITAGVANGELAPAEAADMFKLVDGFTRMLEITLFEQRVARLERAAGIASSEDSAKNSGSSACS